MQLAAVKEIMSTEVFSIERELNITQALEVMRSHGVRRLPVVSKTGRVIGMISQNDCMIAMPKGSTGLGGTFYAPPTVEEVMKDYVYTIGPEESVARAAQLMVNHKVSGLPVVDEQKHILGIVTESDIFRYLAQELGGLEG